MENSYIKWLAKVMFFVIVVICTDILIGLCFQFLRNMAFEKNPYSHELTSMYCVEKAIPDIAIIGSSTANHHYIPNTMEDSLGLSVYNFALDGCFFYYQTLLINLMIDRFSPSYIIWEIGETSLSSAYDNKLEFQNINNLYPWYNKLYVKNIVDKKDRFQKIRMFSNSYVNNSRLFLYLRLCVGDYNCNNKGYIPLDNKTTFPKKVSEAVSTLVSEKETFLIQTIEHCHNRGVKIIFTSSPRYYYDNVKDTEYYKKIREIALQNNIPYIDYYSSEPFCNDSTLFRDNAHLNNRGAELYMSMFIPTLKQTIAGY